MIDDLHTDVDDVKFVDDVTRYEVCNTHSQNNLQNAVDGIQEWATDNNVSLNTNKTKELLVYFEREDLDIPRITINGDVIERVSCAKLLGCHIMSNLSWEDHIANLVSKASRRLHLLRELKRAGLSSKDLLTCYLSFVRSKNWVCLSSLVNSTDDRAEPRSWDHPAPSHADHLPHKTYEEALCEHRLVTLQQRNELCNRLFKDIQNFSHRLNSLLPRQHNPGYQLKAPLHGTICPHGACRSPCTWVNRNVWHVARMSRTCENRVNRIYSSFYFRADCAARAVRLPNQSAADT